MNRLARTLLAVVAATAPAAAAGEGEGAPDHSVFDALLGKYVAESGVRYAEWSVSPNDLGALKTYVARLAATTPSDLADDERLAFWINTYNAVTLNLVLEHYPVDSIKKIGSPWKKKRITVEGRGLSLNDIENEIIRKEFEEPRIHFALNCAAVSCPPLRAEAYSAGALDAQLEKQTVRFLGDESETFVDDNGRLHLSKILDWYRQDFEKNRSVVDWVRPYVPALAETDPDKKVKVKYRSYDWALNTAESPEESPDPEN